MLIKISLTPERQLLTEIGRSPDFPRKTRLPGLSLLSLEGFDEISSSGTCEFYIIGVTVAGTVQDLHLIPF